jgi:membrane associated rhomboid family serine protease
MWALYVLGPQIERGVGSGPFFALYVASAGMGGVAAQFFTPGVFAAVGASGAVFGLFGVWLNLAVRRRNTAAGRSLLSQLGFILLINAALPLIFPAISWQAHLGGFITGFVIGEFWSRLKGPQADFYRASVAVAVALLAIVVVLVV